MTQEPDPTLSESPAESDSEPRRRLILIGGVLAAVLVGLILYFSGDDGTTSASSVDITGIDLTTADGGSMQLSDLSGQPVVVNFFAKWCGPCMAEMPDFEQVHQRLGDRVTILGISKDNSETQWSDMVQETGITFSTVYEGIDGTMFELIGAVAMPTTLFLSPDGIILEQVSAPLTATELTEKISTHFDVDL